LWGQASLPDGAAKLMNFTGQISVERSNYAWALNAGDIVKPQEVVVTGPDGWGLFQVADGSKFEVYPNSKVVFRANRFDWTTLLELMLGKVRVQIEHLGGAPNPNSVRTPTAVISVRGTIFDVEVEPTNTTLVQDEEGIVVVRHLLKPSEVTLMPGQYVRVYQNESLGKALLDKGGIMQKLARAAQDAFYQAAVNGRGTIASKTGAATTGSVTGNKNSGGTAPPAPPPPTDPPPPPH
jgi:hypothetical protein